MQLEEKNREILRLRMNNEEAQLKLGGRQPTFSMQDMAGSLDPEQRDAIVQELSSLVDDMRNELLQIKSNLFSQISKTLKFDNRR